MMQLRGDPWRLRVRRGSPREGPRVERRAKERGPEAEPSEDRGLVIAVRVGCNAAVVRFVARMVCISRTVLHLNRSTRLTEASVEDVVQEVFRRVWANLDGYRGDGPLESWVFGFVQRTMREFARDEMRWRETQRTSSSLVLGL